MKEHHSSIWLELRVFCKQFEYAHQSDAVLELAVDVAHLGPFVLRVTLVRSHD